MGKGCCRIQCIYIFHTSKDFSRLGNLIFPSFQVRVSKEQDHVLISPQGLSYAEVTGANLVSTATLLVITPMCHVHG